MESSFLNCRLVATKANLEKDFIKIYWAIKRNC
jgi:hypothetical protein